MNLIKDIKPMEESNNITKYYKSLCTHLATNPISNNIDLKDKILTDEFDIYRLLNNIKYQRGIKKELDYCNKYKSLETIYRTLCNLCDDYINKEVQK